MSTDLSSGPLLQEFFLKKFVDAAYLKARTDQRKTVQLKDMCTST